MLLTFRQGIVRASPNFLSINGSNVSLQLTGTQPLELTIVNGVNDYYHVESANVSNAFKVQPGSTPQWLYLDLDPVTAVRTFGVTTVEPVVSSTIPSSPVSGLHWFDLNMNQMKVFVGASNAFVVRNRIFVGRYQTNQIFYYPTGQSQVGLSSNVAEFASGRIVYDNAGQAIRTSSGAFLTTESDFFSYGSQTQASKLETNLVYAKAAENIPAYSVVKFSGYGDGSAGEVMLASYEDTSNTTLGFVARSMLIGEVDVVILRGTVTNPQWDWSLLSVPVGTKLYIGVDAEKGQLVYPDPHQIEPARIKQPAVAKILSKTSILFEQGMAGIGDVGPRGPAGVGSDPATASSLGTVSLSLDPVDAENPIVVGTNDPRMSNARHPTAHIHNAVDVATTAFGPYAPSNVQATLQEIHNNKLSVTGGTLTGPLTLSGAPVTPLQAATAQYVTDAINSKSVLKTGSTMTGFLTLSGSPILPQHAATKSYVDSVAASGGGFEWIYFDGVTVSSPYLASDRNSVLVNTLSNPLTVTLPASPQQGDIVSVIPASATYSINPVTINNNGNLIGGNLDSIVISDDGLAVDFVFFGGLIGWAAVERGSTSYRYEIEESGAALFIELIDNGIGHTHVAVVTESQVRDLIAGVVSEVIVTSTVNLDAFPAHVHAVTVNYVSGYFVVTQIDTNHTGTPHTGRFSNSLQPADLEWTFLDDGASSPYVPYEATKGERIIVDTTSGSITIVLPSVPELNDTIIIVPAAPTYSTTPLFISENGNPISGTIDDVEVDVNGLGVQVVWVGGSMGWVLMEAGETVVVKQFVEGPDPDTIINVPGTVYNATGADSDKLLYTTSDSPIDVFLPDTSTVQLKTELSLIQGGAGKTTFNVVGGDVLLALDGLVTTTGPGALASVINVAPGVWWLGGSLE